MTPILPPDELTLSFYEAAQDRSLLPSFLAAMARQFGAHIAGLRIHDSGHSAFTSRYLDTIGITLDAWQAFDNKTGTCNFWRTKGFEDMRADGVGHSDTIMPYRDLRKTRFYNDHLRELDIDHGMGICLWMGPHSEAAIVSLNRPRAPGAFGATEMMLAKRLLPHFRSAYAIMRRLSWANASATSFASAIDHLHIGMILLSDTGKCVYWNETGERTLAQHDGLALTRTHNLRCTDLEAQRCLDEAIRNARLGLLLAPARIYCRDAMGRLCHILVVTMICGDVVPQGIGQDPYAAVFIHSPSSAPKNPETIMRDALHLTTAEARLAALLGTGTRPHDCARQLGVSITTVRTQLRSLFAKTGTGRQAELVSLLQFASRTK